MADGVMTDKELQARFQEKYPRWQWKVQRSSAGRRMMIATLQVYNACTLPWVSTLEQVDATAQQIDMEMAHLLRPYVEDPSHNWETDRVHKGHDTQQPEGLTHG